MANFRLSTGLAHAMQQRACVLANRRLWEMTKDFPLTPEQVQMCVIYPELRRAYNELTTHKAELVQSQQVWGLVYSRLKPSIVRVTYTRSFVVFDPRYRRSQTLQFNAPFYLDHLSDESRNQFYDWYNVAYTEAQVNAVTKTTVDSFFEWNDKSTTPLSVGSIMARWPTLSLLVQDPMWRDRFANPPKSLKRYHWTGYDNRWLAANHKAMKLADMVLTGAVMLPEEQTPYPLSAAVVDWVK